MASNRLTDKDKAEYEKRSGLDKLKQFIPNKDYNDALIEHAAKNAPQLDGEGHTSAVRDAMVERSVAMLSYLRDNGYDFTIEADREAGQLKAKLSDTKMDIRILDTDENQAYVGRIVSSGLVYRFKNNAGKGDKSESGISIPSEAAVDLLKYAMGESVNRHDNTGGTNRQLDTHVGMPDNSGYGYPHTYFTANEGYFATLYSKEKATTKNIGDKTQYVNNDLVIYVVNNPLTSDFVTFRDEDVAVRVSKAEEFVENSRNAAIQNFTEALKLEAVDRIAQSKAAGEFDGAPAFSMDNSFISDMQKSYYEERLSIYSDSDNYSDESVRNDALFAQDEAYKRRISEVFGSVSDRSIDPINVSAYMDKSKGTIINEKNLLAALKTVQNHGEAYELLGEGFAEDDFRDKMISYDKKPVYDSNGNQIYPKSLNPHSEDFENLSEFWKNIGNTVYASLNESGVNVSSIAVDKNGVIHYEGDRHIGKNKVSKPGNKVIGDIGQVFEPDMQATNADGTPNLRQGLIETKFNSGSNYYIAPGYTAYVAPPTGDNVDKPYEERTRLRGYEQEMTHAIKSGLRRDILLGNNFDDSTGLNRVYHRIYGSKLSLDFEEQMAQEGKDDSVVRAIVESSLRRVRYDNCYKEGTNMLAENAAQQKETKKNRGYDIYLDNVRANMAVMNPETSKGIFDAYATGTGTNQGIVRYLTEDAVVNPDGSITKGKSELSPLSAHPDFKYAKYNPPDRLIMSYMNAVNQSSTARGRTENLDGDKMKPIGVGTAHLSLGGYTQDDAFVVSKEFAEANMIRGKDGKMRPLQIGDKICDHSGNKGVISFIADRNADMSYFEHEILHEGMTEKEYNDAVKRNDTKDAQKRIIKLFKDNPTLDVVGAPYTAPSRFNGGTARELIDSQERAREAGMPTTLKIEGREIEGAIGYCNWIITDMPVDEKTHIYDNEGGRKASSQLIAGLAEAGATEVIDEIYKYNDEPTMRAREYLLAVGLDMSQTGEIHREYEPHVTGKAEDGSYTYEQRNEISVKDAFDKSKDATGKLHKNHFRDEFDKRLNDEGGFMRLPFPVTLASGDVTPERLDENGKGTGEYMMPVLAGRYRSGRETVDNKLVVHEYTTNYKNIWKEAGKYLESQRLYNIALTENDTAAIAKQQENMANAQASAQLAYNSMADDIIDRQFTGKRNIWKDNVMRKQLHNTATAVISPDPTLDVNEICMTATMAESINVDFKNPGVVMWRDPLLSAGGIRYFDIRIVENRPGYDGYDERNPLNDMIGISMNPSSATSFEGDFDGDSTGLYVPPTKAARESAMRTLSFPAQMLNKEAGDKGEHELYFQTGLDVAAGCYYDECSGGDIKQRMEQAAKLANEADMNGDVSIGKGSKNMQAYETYNKAMHDAHNASFGCDVISYASPKDHFESLISMTKSGAKGSPKKLCEGYAPYFGCKAEIDENYNLVNFEDVGEPYADVSDRRASLAATHAKAVLTGVAGKFSHHALMMAKNVDEKSVENAVSGLTNPAVDAVNKLSNAAAANSLTHPVTQSVMQLKHDDAETIRRKIDMIKNVAPALWAGHKIEKCFDENNHETWRVVTKQNEKGEYENESVTPEEWKKTFVEFYTDKNGLGVPKPNPEHVEVMAKIMTVEKDGERYIKGFDDKTKDIMSMEKPLDRLAYECTFKSLCHYADRRASLFEGSVNQFIAPKTIRDNIAEERKSRESDARGEEYKPDYKAIAAKDTQVKPVLDAPSVDAVAKILKSNPDADIHIDDGTQTQKSEWERSGHKRHLADGRVIDVKPTVVRRSYDKLSQEAQLEIAKSVFDKGRNGETEFTKPEDEYRNKLKEQITTLNGLGKEERVSYYNAHKEDFREYDMYIANHRDAKAREAGNAAPRYADLAPEAKEAIMRSVATKCLKPVEQRNFTEVEAEFCSISKKQQSQYNSFGTVEKRNAYLKDNPDAFKDFQDFIRINKEVRSAASSSAKPSGQDTVSNQVGTSVTSSAKPAAKTVTPKEENMVVASTMADGVKKNVAPTNQHNGITDN